MLTALLLATAPVTVASKTDLLEFDYSWSAEANAVPTLRHRFRADSVRQRTSALATARQDRKARLEMGGSAAEWAPHSFSRSWETLGSTPRLLSLAGSTGVYSGGAHGNSHTQRLIWDKSLNREIGIQSLLRPGTSWQAAIHQPFCVLLLRERAKRVGEENKTFGGGCPAYGDVPVALEDKDGNARLDHIRITADPYVAGSYAEGEYVISLPITAAMITRLKPEYRSSFEPRPPVR